MNAPTTPSSLERLPLQWVGVSSNRESVTLLKVP